MGRAFYLCTLDLSRTKATGANVNSLVCAVNYSLNPTDIRLPGSVGLTVGMGNVMSKGNALTADAALSHFDTSKNHSCERIFYITFCYLQISK